MSNFFTKIFGDPQARIVDKLRPTVAKINELEKRLEAMSDEGLKKRISELRKSLAVTDSKEIATSAAVGQRLPRNDSGVVGGNGRDSSPRLEASAQNDTKSLDEILPEVFALVREAGKRTLGQRHFDEQMMAGMVLHQGKIAEQKTGEGKTLSATLPVALNALNGQGVHVVTVNDYLARRDVNWMGPIYHFLGLSVACINHEVSYIFDPQAPADQNEITIEMANLRPVSRREAYAADITYGTNNEFGFDYLRDNLAQDIRDKVQRGFNFAIVDEVDSILIDEARTPLIISAPDAESTKLYQTFARLVPRLKRDEDFEIDEKLRTVSIIDAGIDKIEQALGFKNIYQEGGVRYIHQLEQALRAYALFKRDRDYLVKDDEVLIIDEFTGRLMPGRRYSEGLHQALEAKENVRVQDESRTLASITFQNYFRLYKKLAGMTGTAASSAEEFAGVYKLDVVVLPTHVTVKRQDLADKIYRTEKAKFAAIIEEIRQATAKGQPVLVGTRSVERNEYMAALLSRAGVEHEVLNAKNHEREAQIIAQAGRPGAVTVATNMAGRGVDIVLGGKQISHPEPRAQRRAKDPGPSPADGGNGRDSSLPPSLSTSKAFVQNDSWQKLHDQVIQAGGLYVIGTERHEARRIDDQLRGRSGRQGDPGKTEFFASMEDELMRIFGGDRLKNLMTMLHVPDDMPIENKMISRSIETAQRRVEGHNFDSRKHTLEYDDVLNQQRQFIYQKRDEILTSIYDCHCEEVGESGNSAKPDLSLRAEASSRGVAISDKASSRKAGLKQIILAMIQKEIERTVAEYSHERIDPTAIIESLNNWLPIDGQAVKSELEKIVQQRLEESDKIKQVNDYLIKTAQAIYGAKETKLGQETMAQLVKFVLLRTYDIFWMEHLDNMEHLRQSVSLRAYGQRDPLVEYKNEGSRLFKDLAKAVQTEVVNLLFKLEPQSSGNVIARTSSDDGGRGNLELGHAVESGNSQARPLIPTGKKQPGRNDPCPCGSGRNLKSAVVNSMLKLGKYRHYKGNEYEVVGVAKHSETFEELVVYRALYGNHDLWVRPLKMFTGEVEIDGKKVLRFEYFGE